MAKKKVEQVTAVRLLDKNVTSTAHSVVDMKVSKADLFDLVINETESELEAETKVASDAADATREALSEAVQELGKKSAQPVADALIAASRTPGLKGHLKSDKPQISVNHNTDHEDNLTVSFSVELGTDDYYNRDGLFMRARSVPVKVTAALKKLHRANRVAQERHSELRRELNELRKQTKKMKTQVVRSILNSSGEGKHILTGLDQMKKVFRAERRKLLANS